MPAPAGQGDQNNGDTINQQYNLDADLLINDDTATKVVKLEKSATFSAAGTLKVQTIKGQMCCFEKELLSKYLGTTNNEHCDPNKCQTNPLTANMFEQIALSDITSTFTAKLTLADGLEFANDASASLTGADGLFKIAETDGFKVENNVATVTMNLTGNYTNYKQLKDAVNAVQNELKVTVTGIKFKDTAEADKAYQITGEVNGSFSATAKYEIVQASKKFVLSWNGVQTQAGKYEGTDSIAAAVQYTAEVPEEKPEPEPEIEYVPSAPKPTEVKMQVAKTGEIATSVSSLGLVTLLAVGAYLAKKH